MNIKHFEEHITQKWENRYYTKELKQENPIIQYLFDNNISEWEEIEKYLKSVTIKNKQSHFLKCIGRSGDEIICYDIYKECYGTQYLIEYKGMKLELYCDCNGEIESNSLRFVVFESWGNYNSVGRIELKDNIEEYYQEFLVNVKKSKRNAMTYYNSEIKRIKQDYKRQLKLHNVILKGEER